MLIKNEVPILEYDDKSSEIIPPSHGKEEFLPEICVFAFLGSIVDEFVKNHDGKIVDVYETVGGNYNIYVVEYKNKKICLVRSPIGAPAATGLLDTLIAYGCKKCIACGSCGVLVKLQENEFLIPVKALRGEGTSYQYLPASRYVEIDEKMVLAIENEFIEKKLPYKKCITWTTDGFFRETRDMVKYRIEEGCSVVEMECSALACCAKKRGASFGQFLFTADSLSNVDDYDPRNFGIDSHGKALELALEIIIKL